MVDFKRIFHPPPAAPAFGGDKVIPEHTASWFSRISLGWLTPLLRAGFTRPLQDDDLWHLAPNHLSPTIADQLEAAFYGQENSTTEPPETPSEKPTQHPSDNAEGRQNPSLFRAIHSTFFWTIWTPGVLKLISASLQTTSPLVSKALINYLMTAYFHYRLPELTPAPPSIGVGIALAIGIFLMQVLASLCENHYAQMTMTSGLLLRSAVIDNVFRKSLRLSGRARLEHNNGQITNMISKDAVRLENSLAMVHSLWVTPIQLIIAIALLIHNLGIPAVIGVGVMIGLLPFQGITLGLILFASKRIMVFTDSRVRIMQEVLYGIRIIKLFASEDFYARKIFAFRKKELRMVRYIALGIAVLVSSVGFIPTLGAIAAFVTYAKAGNDLTPDVIFSSIQLFDVIRMPLTFLPMALATSIDAYVSLGRISKFLTAEDIPEPPPVDPSSKYAVVVDNGNFTWEKSSDNAEKKPEGEKPIRRSRGANAKSRKETLPTVLLKETTEETADQKPFELKHLNLKINKGAFVAIVGRVGSGKSSLMNAILGEMRMTQGNIAFGGEVAYVPQVPWIMNATLKDNITRYRTDELKFREVIRICCLEHDLEILPQGEQTEIGEKGINLSGGQKARVALARAVFSGAPVVLLDDPLSAVDAAVGKAILEHCLLAGPLAERTRVLVTHSLSVLPHTDYIYVMDNGEITEQGTYTDLLQNGHAFSRLIEEFGSVDTSKIVPTMKTEFDTMTPEAIDTIALMDAEERATGRVPWEIYKAYLRGAGGIIWAPLLVFLLLAMQASQIAGRLVLSFWTSKEFPNFADGDYEALYGGLGAAQALLSFLSCFGFSLVGIQASSTIFKEAMLGVLRSPMSFYEVSPMGRIVSRLSADLAKLDTQLAMSFWFVFSTACSVFGVIALVFYSYPYLGIMFAPLGLSYWLALSFYRRTSIEVKRLDAILRSTLYASYSEALTGLATIRASREQNRFIERTETAIDIQNRAGYITITAQRWLALRLDMLGNALVFAICLFAIGYRETVDPSKVGLVLTYTLAITSALSGLITRFAQTEQDMNAIERLVTYAALTPEAPPRTSHDPPSSWPANGAISFKAVTLAYRPSLPAVLHDVSFEIKAGEKVGIVGRTGAGKSSLLQALFRIVEVQSGTIVVDGVDIRNIGLDVLRRQLAVIPQDSLLFQGTLRENIDPQSTRTDAELIEALRRAWLLPQIGVDDPVAEAKFSLDSPVGDEGSNFSAGERQLVALTRALVKGSKIIVLDEATSNVDVETDSKLQRTIQTHFSSSTLLCIAHRLNTVAHYDRILVMNAGEVAEFDSPLDLFDRPDSIFRSLCDEARLTRAEIVRIRTSGNGSEAGTRTPSTSA